MSIARSAVSGRLSIAALLVLGAGIVLGIVINRTANGPWTLRGTGYSAEGAISIEANGWTYGVPMDVAWTDETGLFHERYRPSCLPASGAIVSVTFMAVAAELGGVGIRPVIWVDCRGAVVEPPPNP